MKTRVLRNFSGGYGEEKEKWTPTLFSLTSLFRQSYFTGSRETSAVIVDLFHVTSFACTCIKYRCVGLVLGGILSCSICFPVKIMQSSLLEFLCRNVPYLCHLFPSSLIVTLWRTGFFGSRRHILLENTAGITPLLLKDVLELFHIGSSNFDLLSFMYHYSVFREPSHIIINGVNTDLLLYLFSCCTMSVGELFHFSTTIEACCVQYL